MCRRCVYIKRSFIFYSFPKLSDPRRASRGPSPGKKADPPPSWILLDDLLRSSRLPQCLRVWRKHWFRGSVLPKLGNFRHRVLQGFTSCQFQSQAKLSSPQACVAGGQNLVQRKQYIGGTWFPSRLLKHFSVFFSSHTEQNLWINFSCVLFPVWYAVVNSAQTFFSPVTQTLYSNYI